MTDGRARIRSLPAAPRLIDIARGLAIVFGIVVALGATAAEAQIVFGTREDIHPIVEVGLQGPEGEPLFLGYKTSTSYFLGGLAMSNDGYVLGLRADPDRFIDMPDGEALKSFQAQKLLPDPLPAYSIGILDYVRGYSLWLFIGLVVAGYVLLLVRRRPRRRRQSY